MSDTRPRRPSLLVGGTGRRTPPKGRPRAGKPGRSRSCFARRGIAAPYYSYGEDSVSGKPGQRAIITTTIIIAAIGIAPPFSWLGDFPGFVRLPPAYWIALCLIVPSYVILTHVAKTWFIRRFGLS
jgi:hypothetical protein